MDKRTYIIRTMQRHEIDIAIAWAAEEGWNPGLHDAESYYRADPNGFLIGLLNDEPVAVISAIRYDASFGFLGFYIVKPHYRNQGYGIQIWNAALQYLKGLNIALDGVVAQQENYKKSGFVLAYRNIRYEGVGGGEGADHPDIVPLSVLPFEIVEAYDRQFFPARRYEFLKAWIAQPDAHALGIMHEGKLAGYGVIRQCRNGYKIGPLYAENPELAEVLFSALKKCAGASEPVFLDIAEVNADALSLVKRHNMRVSFETARMYTKTLPDLPLKRIFGITSFEIG